MGGRRVHLITSFIQCLDISCTFLASLCPAVMSFTAFECLHCRSWKKQHCHAYESVYVASSSWNIIFFLILCLNLAGLAQAPLSLGSLFVCNKRNQLKLDHGRKEDIVLRIKKYLKPKDSKWGRVEPHRSGPGLNNQVTSYSLLSLFLSKSLLCACLSVYTRFLCWLTLYTAQHGLPQPLLLLGWRKSNRGFCHYL